MTSKALIVGINLYKSPIVNTLHGCVNDAQNVAYTLSTLGIVPAQPNAMKILTDTNATKSNILEKLEWLTKDAKKGDLLIYYHSSHGTQVVDVEVDEKIDHMDEALCPYDVASNVVIKDDDLNNIFSKVPDGVTLDIICDTCFSGGMAKEIVFDTQGIVVKTRTSRYMAPILDVDFFLRANPLLPKQKILGKQKILRKRKGEKEVAIVDINHVLWGACRENQISNEDIYEDKYQGAFTYCYCKLLRKYYSEGITREKLDALVGQALNQLGELQIPQLEGTKINLEKNVFT